ncbi:DUF1643 domain-containing protein [Paramaledivibacter caminithermalis]|uniref:DUF1643 domain-containing protein n=1 Tax=Paramaledivibacter caminithermalis (strain DSM 15212 / CIP 107654 / DViRD3) TaxID=1121301 RepID=A0A1M6NB67_PARC5|nr:DUF1643 domain-containing protein [Paramaledivibacter caminithermalis]SHJ92941.1 hypothetical protein SAMN02745912_01647 [Paramaledivibacter caminithermalis DSM 15212]
MSTIQKSTIKKEVHFSEDGKHRYLLKKEWSKTKKKAMVIMKNPSDAGKLLLDHTTMFVINNLVKLDYGSVEILNLYSKINAKTFAEMEEDEEAIKTNDTYITNAAARVDTIVLAWGSGCSTSKKAAERQQTVLKLLEKHKEKIVVIEDQRGRSGFHPLSPQVRRSWKLKKVNLEDILKSEGGN